MIFDLAFFGLLIFCSPALICGYYAANHGRSFWFWLIAATLLPVVAQLVLLLLPDKAEPLAAEVEALKISNALLGNGPGLPADPALRKALARPTRDQVGFAASPGPAAQLHIHLNGLPLAQWLGQMQRAPLRSGLQYLPLADVLYPSRHFLGGPLLTYRGDEDGRTALMVRTGTEPVPSHLVKARILLLPYQIIWYDFVEVEGTVVRRLPQLGPLVFERLAYLESLDEATRPVPQQRT
ncbi:MAG: hypothetical protein MUC97_07125 [Bernardetiaceae bacterium]|jgi:hypothetical protein|nr:hypothetical protein [Bernardetiaceae bacterium]